MDYISSALSRVVGWVDRKVADDEQGAIAEDRLEAARLAAPILHSLMFDAVDVEDHSILIEARKILHAVLNNEPDRPDLMGIARSAHEVVSAHGDENGPIRSLINLFAALESENPRAMIRLAQRVCEGNAACTERLQCALDTENPSLAYLHCHEAWAAAQGANQVAYCALAAHRNRTIEGHFALLREQSHRVEARVKEGREQRIGELKEQLLPKAIENFKRDQFYLEASKRGGIERLRQLSAPLSEESPIRVAIEAAALSRNHLERHTRLGLAWYQAVVAGEEAIAQTIEEVQTVYASGERDPLRGHAAAPTGPNPALTNELQQKLQVALEKAKGNLELEEALTRALGSPTPLTAYRWIARAHALGGDVDEAMRCIDLGRSSTLDKSVHRLDEAENGCQAMRRNGEKMQQEFWQEAQQRLAGCRHFLDRAFQSTNAHETLNALALAEWYADLACCAVGHETAWGVTLREELQSLADFGANSTYTTLLELKRTIARCRGENGPFEHEYCSRELQERVFEIAKECKIDSLTNLLRSLSQCERTIDLQARIAIALYLAQLPELKDHPSTPSLCEKLLAIRQQLKLRRDERTAAAIDRLAEASLRGALQQNWRSLIAWGVLGFFALYSPWNNRPRTVIAIAMSSAILSAWRPEVDGALRVTTQYAQQLTERLMGQRYEDKLLLGSILLFPSMWLVVQAPILGPFIRVTAGFGVAALAGNLLWQVQRKGYDSHHPKEQKRFEEWKSADFLSIRRWADLAIEKIALQGKPDTPENQKLKLGIEVASTVVSLAKLHFYATVGFAYCMTTNAHSYIGWVAGAAVISSSSEVVSTITEHPVPKAVISALSTLGIAIASIVGLIAAVGFVPGFLLGRWAKGPLHVDITKLCGPVQSVWWWNQAIAATIGAMTGNSLWALQAALFGFRKESQSSFGDEPRLDGLRGWLDDRVPPPSLDRVRSACNRWADHFTLDPVRNRLSLWIGGR